MTCPTCNEELLDRVLSIAIDIAIERNGLRAEVERLNKERNEVVTSNLQEKLAEWNKPTQYATAAADAAEPQKWPRYFANKEFVGSLWVMWSEKYGYYFIKGGSGCGCVSSVADIIRSGHQEITADEARAINPKAVP